MYMNVNVITLLADLPVLLSQFRKLCFSARFISETCAAVLINNQL